MTIWCYKDLCIFFHRQCLKGEKPFAITCTFTMQKKRIKCVHRFDRINIIQNEINI